MRILQLTPGTGTFLCGSCLRDNTLVRALREQGHDAVIAPLYLPFALEEPGPEQDAAVHMGGINMYLQQKLPALRHLPGFVHDRLDSPRLLRWAAGRSNMTDAPGLGAMTVSMLSGEEGRQHGEIERLLAWARELPRPDVVLLSNAMLIGLVRRLKAALDCPVLVTLQGEAPFLDSLDETHRLLAWRTLSDRAREVDGFLPVSQYTAALMGERLNLEPAKLHVVWNGIDLTGFQPAPAREAGPPTVGFLARMCEDKGLPTLVEAFLRVRESLPEARLIAAGVVLSEDRAPLEALRARVREAGAVDAIEFRGPIPLEEKRSFLQGVDVLSVPATYGESFGLYLLEAWACGVPVVQPRSGAFPELVEASGAGELCEPDDVDELARVLVQLLRDPGRRARLGAAGRAAVEERFTAARMAREVGEVCTMVAAGGA